MTAFDDPKYLPSARRSVFRVAADAVSNQPAVVAATIFTASLILTLSALVSVADQAINAALTRMVASTKISLVVNPHTGRAEAEALGSRLRALPTVADATLRPREEALAKLGQDALPTTREGGNPLPDVWLVTLKVDETLATGAQSMLPPFSRARDEFAMLPDVDSVRVDLRWLQVVDEWRALIRSYRQEALNGALLALGIALAGLCFVAGRALQTEANLSDMRALALVALFEAAASSVLAIVFTVPLTAFAAPIFATVTGKLATLESGHIDSRTFATLSIYGLIVMVAGTMASASRR